MSTHTKPKMGKIPQCDAISPAELRSIKSERVSESASSPEIPSPQPEIQDMGDGRIPGTPAYELLESEAARLSERAGGIFLYGIMFGEFKSSLDAFSYAFFMRKFVADMQPTDPMEVMMIEQICLLHFELGRAHIKAANATSAEAAGRYYSAVAKLHAEFRQSFLAFTKSRSGRPNSSSESKTITAPPLSTATHSPKKKENTPATPCEEKEGVANRLNGYFQPDIATQSRKGKRVKRDCAKIV